MGKNQLILRIDDILEDLGFHRKGEIWNRESTDYVDVIDLQIGKSKDMFTVNVGIADKFVFGACWPSLSSGIVDESSCTVRARLGELLHGRDVWWYLDESNNTEEVLRGIKDTAIPFIHLNHSTDIMIESLEANPVSKRYPPESIYLALLYYKNGEKNRGIDMLNSIKTNDGWKKMAFEIANFLN